MSLKVTDRIKTARLALVKLKKKREPKPIEYSLPSDWEEERIEKGLKEYGKVSATFIQRVLKINYGRAKFIYDLIHKPA